jgi:hypothetical protein
MAKLWVTKETSVQAKNELKALGLTEPTDYQYLGSEVGRSGEGLKKQVIGVLTINSDKGLKALSPAEVLSYVNRAVNIEACNEARNHYFPTEKASGKAKASKQVF